ncbi:hypothetical protein SteCoe_16561 [Stentor coeruleus]|uniref:GAR domain-containing protein n=1 Tax=Stentor coeruleus TaxID=5963 RepID=A0A1R2C149_9CILI|nr:hypothetical protein SteCoe_16561 [Stentor coeruleus]
MFEFQILRYEGDADYEEFIVELNGQELCVQYDSILIPQEGLITLKFKTKGSVSGVSFSTDFLSKISTQYLPIYSPPQEIQGVDGLVDEPRILLTNQKNDEDFEEIFSSLSFDLYQKYIDTKKIHGKEKTDLQAKIQLLEIDVLKATNEATLQKSLKIDKQEELEISEHRKNIIKSNMEFLVQDMESQITVLESSLEKNSNTLYQVHNINKNLINEFENQLEKYQSIEISVSESTEALINHIQALKSQIVSQEKHIKSIETEKEMLKQSLTIEKLRINAKNCIGDFYSVFQKQMLSDLKVQILRSNEKISELESNLSLSQCRQQASEEKYHSSLLEKETFIIKLSSELKKAQENAQIIKTLFEEKTENYEDTIEMTNKELEKMRLENSQLKDKGYDLREAFKKAQERNGDLISQLDEKKSLLISSQKACLELEENFAEAKEKVFGLSYQLEEARNQCSQWQKACCSLQESLRKSQDENMELGEHLEKTKDLHGQMSKNCSTLQEIVKRTQERNSELVQENESVRNSYTKSQNMSFELQESLKNTKEQHRELVLELEDNKNMLEKLRNDNQDLSEKLRNELEMRSFVEKNIDDMKIKYIESQENKKNLEETLRESERKMKESEEKIVLMMSEIEDIKRILEIKIKENYKNVEEKENLCEKNAHMSSEIRTLNEKNLELEEKITKAEEKILEISSEIENKEGFLYQLKEKCQELTEKLFKAESNNKEIIQELEKAKDLNSESESHCNDLEASLKISEDHNLKVTQELETIKTLLSQSENQNEKLENLLKASTQTSLDLSQNLETIKSQYSTCQNTCHTLQQSLQKSQEKNTQLIENLEMTKNSLSDSQSKCQNLQENLSSLLNKNTTLAQELEKTKTHHSQSYSTLQDCNKQLTQELEDSSSQISQLQKANLSFQENIKKSQDTIKDLTHDLETLKNINLQTEKKNEDLQESLKNAKEKTLDLQKHLHESQDQNSHSQNICIKLQELLKISQEKISDLEETLKAYVPKETLDQNQQSYEKKLSIQENYNKILETNCEQLRMTVEELEETLKNSVAKEQINKTEKLYEEKIGALETHIRVLQFNAEKLQTELADAVKNLMETKSNFDIERMQITRELDKLGKEKQRLEDKNSEYAQKIEGQNMSIAEFELRIRHGEELLTQNKIEYDGQISELKNLKAATDEDLKFERQKNSELRIKVQKDSIEARLKQEALQEQLNETAIALATSQENCEVYQEKISGFIGKIKDLESQLKNSVQKDKHKKKIEDFEEKTLRLEAENSSKSQELEVIKAKFDELEKALIENSQDFLKEKSRLVTHLDENKESLEKSQSHCEELISRLEKAHEKILALENIIENSVPKDHFNTICVGYEEKISLLDLSVGKLFTESEMQKSHISELEEVLLSKTNSFELSLAEISQKAQQTAEDLELQIIQVADFKDKNHSLNLLSSHLTNKAQKYFSDLQDALLNLKESQAQYQNIIKAYHTFSVSSETKTEKLNQKLTQVNDKNSKLQNAYLDTVDSLTSALETINKQKLDLENTRNLKNDFINQVEYLTKECEDNSKIFIDMSSRNKSLEEAVGILRESLQNKCQIIESLEENIKTMKNEKKTHAKFLSILSSHNPADPETVDKMLNAYLISKNTPNNFVKISDGVYSHKNKKVCVCIRNGSLVIRVGGGYMFIDEFLKQYGEESPEMMNHTLQKSVELKKNGLENSAEECYYDFSNPINGLSNSLHIAKNSCKTPIKRFS